jgi:hypothetical protein
MRRAILTGSAPSMSRRLTASALGEMATFEEGDHVMHPMRGRGRVIRVRNDLIETLFDNGFRVEFTSRLPGLVRVPMPPAPPARAKPIPAPGTMAQPARQRRSKHRWITVVSGGLPSLGKRR